MGTQYNVRVFAPSVLTEYQQSSLGDGIFAALDRVDRLMSSYRQDSEISRLNTAPVNEPITLSKETFEVISKSKEVFDLSGGAFDITVAPLIDLWGFGAANHAFEVPDKERLAQVLARIGMDKLALDASALTVTKLAPLELNVSAIAKGFGVDLVVEYLDGQGLDSYLVEVGGEIFARGSKMSGKSWVLGIEAPDFPGRKAIRTVALKDLALATSGDYRNYVEKDGVRYSHTIDPVSAAPVLHKLASVSVISSDCALADALATALMVKGEREGIKLAREQGLDALFIVRTDSGFDFQSTGRFSTLVN